MSGFTEEKPKIWRKALGLIAFQILAGCLIFIVVSFSVSQANFTYTFAFSHAHFIRFAAVTLGGMFYGISQENNCPGFLQDKTIKKICRTAIYLQFILMFPLVLMVLIHELNKPISSFFLLFFMVIFEMGLNYGFTLISLRQGISIMRERNQKIIQKSKSIE